MEPGSVRSWRRPDVPSELWAPQSKQMKIDPRSGALTRHASLQLDPGDPGVIIWREYHYNQHNNIDEISFL